MAKKLKLISLFQEVRGRAQVTNRHPAPSPTGMFLMQLRAQTGTTTLPRRRFMISVELPPPQVSPHPVKINHVRVTEVGASPAAKESLHQPTSAGARPNLPQVRSDVG